MEEAGRGVDEVERRKRECQFRRLYEDHFGAVSAYTRRRATTTADALDAVAETFTIAWRRIGEVPDADAARPWLYGVARRVLANQRRGDRRRGELSSRLRGYRAGPVELDSDLATVEEARAVRAALARLKEADQEVLRLAVWEELSHRDIAEMVGCSEASVAVRLHRARNRLAKEIGKEERRAGHGGDREANPGRRAEGQES
jgi:RNA polymerase sigma factor (sigma-70 family)